MQKTKKRLMYSLNGRSLRVCMFCVKRDLVCVKRDLVCVKKGSLLVCMFCSVMWTQVHWHALLHTGSFLTHTRSLLTHSRSLLTQAHRHALQPLIAQSDKSMSDLDCVLPVAAACKSSQLGQLVGPLLACPANLLPILMMTRCAGGYARHDTLQYRTYLWLHLARRPKWPAASFCVP